VSSLLFAVVVVLSFGPEQAAKIVVKTIMQAVVSRRFKSFICVFSSIFESPAINYTIGNSSAWVVWGDNEMAS
jgi:hypothetical protein